MKQKYQFYPKEKHQWKNFLLQENIVCRKKYDFSSVFFMPCIMLPI